MIFGEIRCSQWGRNLEVSCNESTDSASECMDYLDTD